MKSHWRKLYSILPRSLEKKLYKRYFIRKHHQWISNGSVNPPSHLSKQNILKEYASTFGIATFVETGTYLGDMLYALESDFDRLYSIELSELFYLKAIKRFKISKKIQVIKGDSGQKLTEVMKDIKSSALFWLDGHYSGGNTAKGNKECPIYEELQIILKSNHKHIIIIDDARCFIGKNDYPTIEELRQFIYEKNPQYKFSVYNDAIHLT